MTNPDPRPRWRFSLRTLFALTALVGFFVGYQLNWIRQRHDFIDNNHLDWEIDPFLDPFADTPRVVAPGMLWLFGEVGETEIRLSNRRDRSREEEEALLMSARSLFPEARVLGPADN